MNSSNSNSFTFTPLHLTKFFLHKYTHRHTVLGHIQSFVSKTKICFIYSLFCLSQSIFHMLFSRWFHYCFGQFIFIFESVIFIPFVMPPRSTVSSTVFVDFRIYCYTCVLNWIFLHANLVFLPLFLALNLSKWYILLIPLWKLSGVPSKCVRFVLDTYLDVCFF